MMIYLVDVFLISYVENKLIKNSTYILKLEPWTFNHGWLQTSD